MGLTADVNAEPIKRWTRPIVDAHLGPVDAAEFAELLADPGTNINALRRALLARGIHPSEAAVQKWAAAARLGHDPA